MFSRDRQVVLKLEKSPPSLEDQLKDPMPTEQKIEITKDIMSFGAGLYVFCKIVDTCGKLAVVAAKARL